MPTATRPPAAAPLDDLLLTVLDVALAGYLLLRPVYGAGGAVVDFAYDYLNPAARQMLDLPAHPAESFLTLFPAAAARTGVFAFYRTAFETGQPAEQEFAYHFDGLHGVYSLVARRSGERLVVRFTDGYDAARTGAELALQEGKHREQVARAEAERQRSELARVFEQAPVAIAVFRGPQYIIELANPTVCRLWGRTAADIVGKGLFEALPEVAGMGFEELLDGVMATGTPHVAHAMPAVHDRDGRRDTVYWDFVYVPMHEADGRIYGAMVVATDATAQVLARQQMEQLNEELEMRVTARSAEARAALFEAEQQREQLREQQHLLQQILGQVPAFIATFSGPRHRLTFANAAYQRLMDGRAVPGHPLAEAVPELGEQGFLALLDQVYDSGQPYIGREILVVLHQPTPDDQRYFDFIYQPLTDEKAQVQGILAFAVDVSEQVRARRQVETLQAAALAAVQRRAQQRQELYQIVEQTPVAIVLLREPGHRIDYFNPAFAELFPPDDWAGSLHGHTLAEVYPHMDVAGLVALLDLVYDTGEPQTVIDMPLAALQPGSPRFITLSYQAYREEGRIVGVAAFAYDVTDQVLGRQQVQELNAELQAANAELSASNARLSRTNADLDTFVYSASHDLKSPITNVEGLLLALRQQLPPAVLRTDLVGQLLDMMDGAVARFQETLGHLTDVSRLPQLLADQTPEAVDLPALVEAVRLDMLPELTAAGATLALDITCPTLRFAAKNLRSILYNLLSNAVKYRAFDRPLRIALRCHRTAAGPVRLEVQDNGLGLTAAQQQELFQLFRRLHSHVPGSGVGLYMVKKMVDNAGGLIAVQSEPDKGVTFTITLPATT